MSLALDVIKKKLPTKTVRFPIRHLSVRSEKHLWLLLKWAGRKEYQVEIANISMRNLNEAESAKAHHEAIARHLIVGWENVLDENGKPEPYTAEGGALILEACGDRVDVLLELHALLRSGDNFLDAGDLGNA